MEILTGSDLTSANLTGVTYCNTLMPDGGVKNPHKGLCPGQSTPPAPGAPIPLPATSPFYGAINALINGHQVAAGSVVNSCKIQAYTKCPGAKLANSDLQGGFLGYATLDKANLSGSNFYLGSMAFAHANQTNFTGIQLGTTPAVNTIIGRPRPR